MIYNFRKISPAFIEIRKLFVSRGIDCELNKNDKRLKAICAEIFVCKAFPLKDVSDFVALSHVAINGGSCICIAS